MEGKGIRLTSKGNLPLKQVQAMIHAGGEEIVFPMAIFGSAATGKFNAHSDLDFLVEFEQSLTAKSRAAAEKIQRFVADNTEAEYLASELLQSAVERQFDVIGDYFFQTSLGLAAVHESAVERVA